MKDQHKTKSELLDEVNNLRRQITELEEMEADHKQTQEELRESEECFRAFMDNNPASIYIKDANDRHIYGNPAAFESVGKKPDEFIGSTTRDFFPPEVAGRLVELDQRVLKEGSSRVTEEFNFTEKGDRRWIRDIKFPIHIGAEEKFLGGIGIDITDLKLAEQALAEQLEFEKLIADIASRLAQAEAKQLDDVINEMLQSLGQFLRTERCFLAQFTEDGEKLVFTNIWTAENVSFSSSIFEIDLAAELPWVAQQIRNGRVINAGPGLVELPDEAKGLRDWLERDGINSRVVVPVRVEYRSIGMLGLDTVVQPREYPQSIVERLQIVADMNGETMRRVRTQEALKEQLQFEDLISNLSATFINIKASDIDKNIERGLQLLVEFLDIERGNLFQFSRDQERLNLTHSFARKGVKHSPRILFGDHHPWFTKKLLSRESFCFSHPTELPEEAQLEKDYLIQQGIKSALILPLEAAGVVQGGITLSSLRRERRWSENLIQRFNLLTEVFSSALLRKRADEEISEAYTVIKELKDRIKQENIYLREEIALIHKHQDIVGQSDVMKSVLGQAKLVAATDSTVLISGETGTGKELLAHAIHNLSSRKERPMLTVNCSALPASLIESELFGREKGAYTGALTRQIGRFEVADGSTILLDEISEIPLELQTKLLRVIEDGTLERLGSSRSTKVDVRVVAATNRDLAKEVSQGRFREDLYYRLNVFPLTVPPLRERREDIPLLVWAFVREYGERMGKRIESIPRKSMEALQRYFWPGNVRELKNVVERAMILSKGPGLYVEIPGISDLEKPDSPMTLEEVGIRHISNVLESTGWRVRGKNGAAEILGLKPTTLDSRIKKLGIPRRPE